MSNPSRLAIEAALRLYQDPYLQQDLLSAGCIKSIDIEYGQVYVEVDLGYPAKGIFGGIAQLLTHNIENVDGVKKAHVNIVWQIKPGTVQGQLDTMECIKNIIVVASGKGVGKSTTAANLALALAAEGARTGILDADIYGPSMGQMFGIPAEQRPEIKNNQFFMPIESLKIQLMSMAFLLTKDTPVVWRGPMVSGALQQLLTQTWWSQLDYLVVDMPPGTGDIQLTLAQKIPVTGSVIVTTPQDLALIDAKKGIEMFRKVGIPVLGIVENMALHICSHCGHSEPLFGEGGGSHLAEIYTTDLLASLPLSMMIREQADEGLPTVGADSESQIAMIYRDMARKLGAILSLKNRQQSVPPEILENND